MQTSATAPPLPGSVLVGSVLAIVGAATLAAAPFLPWVTRGMLSATGVQRAGEIVYSLVALAVLGCVAPLATLATRRTVAGWAAIVCGVIGATVTGLLMVSISETMTASGALGAGVYVAFAGCGIMATGGIATFAA